VARLARQLQHNPLLAAGSLLALTVVLAAALAPWLAPHDRYRQFPNGLDALGAPLPPSRAFPLGTDSRGRDQLSRLLFGARISLVVGVTATAIATTVGTVLGLAAGYFGGAVDTALMRVTDVFMAFPALLLAIALAAVLRPSVGSVILVISLVNWTGIARVVRGEALSLRERLYVEAAHALGATHARVLGRHILPHLAPILLVLASLSIATTVLLDAGLGYLGIGVPAPEPSWGSMLTDGQRYYRTAPWLALWPGLAVLTTVAAFNLLAAGARQALDPRRNDVRR
jgi:peptide/nickel transport system permease protein